MTPNASQTALPAVTTTTYKSSWKKYDARPSKREPWVTPIDPMLVQVMEVQSHSRQTDDMVAFIRAFANAHDMTVAEEHGNIYLTKGRADLYPAYVAHTDTVHTLIPKHEFKVMFHYDHLFAYDLGQMEQTGIGGDDKVGIYLALRMLQDLPAAKAAFFRDEEIGCVGAALADLDFFNDCAFVLEGDRRGHSDVVCGSYGDRWASKAFQKAIRPIAAQYGKGIVHDGIMTDVQELKDTGLPISAVNVSCGYYSPHSSHEIIHLHDVDQTRQFFQAVGEQLGDRQWEHYSPPRWTKYGKGSIYDDVLYGDDNYADYLKEGRAKKEWVNDDLNFPCPHCGEPALDYWRTKPMEIYCWECGKEVPIALIADQMLETASNEETD